MNPLWVRSSSTQLSRDAHLDSEGAPLPLRIQTLVSKTQQDLEARRRPAVESVALNLYMARKKEGWRHRSSSTLLVGFKWIHSNFTQKVRRPLSWFNAESPAHDNYANSSQPSSQALTQLELLRQVGERSCDFLIIKRHLWFVALLKVTILPPVNESSGFTPAEWICWWLTADSTSKGWYLPSLFHQVTDMTVWNSCKSSIITYIWIFISKLANPKGGVEVKANMFYFSMLSLIKTDLALAPLLKMIW